MKREQAKEKAVFEAIDYFANSSEEKLELLQKHIDKIYDYFENKDILKRLDSLIRDYYVAKGYKLDGTWGFQVIISTKWEKNI